MNVQAVNSPYRLGYLYSSNWHLSSLLYWVDELAARFRNLFPVSKEFSRHSGEFLTTFKCSRLFWMKKVRTVRTGRHNFHQFAFVSFALVPPFQNDKRQRKLNFRSDDIFHSKSFFPFSDVTKRNRELIVSNTIGLFAGIWLKAPQ